MIKQNVKYFHIFAYILIYVNKNKNNNVFLIQYYVILLTFVLKLNKTNDKRI